MKIVSNEKLIARNHKIGQWVSIIGLIVLVVATILAFRSVELLNISFFLLVIGFLFSQVGIYLGNRWGRSPRPDENLETALKGLDDSYTLYHYMAPVPHLLVGPAGVWTLNPRNIRGTITYDERRGRWRQRGGNPLLKVLAQEGLGRPDLEINADIQTIQRFFGKSWEDGEPPEVNAALVFTDEGTQVEADNAPHPTLHARKLKEFIRREAKDKPISQQTYERVRATLPQESIQAK